MFYESIVDSKRKKKLYSSRFVYSIIESTFNNLLSIDVFLSWRFFQIWICVLNRARKKVLEQHHQLRLRTAPQTHSIASNWKNIYITNNFMHISKIQPRMNKWLQRMKHPIYKMLSRMPTTKVLTKSIINNNNKNIKIIRFIRIKLIGNRLSRIAPRIIRRNTSYHRVLFQNSCHRVWFQEFKIFTVVYFFSLLWFLKLTSELKAVKRNWF